MRRRTDSNGRSDRKKIPALAGILLCVMIFVSLSASQVQAKVTSGMFSGAYLYSICASNKKGREIVKGGHTACQAYIAGVVDYHKLLKALGVAPLIDFCVPNTEPMVKLQRIVWRYLDKNRQHMEFIAAPTVTLALYQSYPCAENFAKKKR